MIVKEGNEYCVKSESGKNLGKYKTRARAKKRLAQIEMFKHMDAHFSADFVPEDHIIVVDIVAAFSGTSEGVKKAWESRERQSPQDMMAEGKKEKEMSESKSRHNQRMAEHQANGGNEKLGNFQSKQMKLASYSNSMSKVLGQLGQLGIKDIWGTNLRGNAKVRDLAISHPAQFKQFSTTTIDHLSQAFHHAADLGNTTAAGLIKTKIDEIKGLSKDLEAHKEKFAPEMDVEVVKDEPKKAEPKKEEKKPEPVAEAKHAKSADEITETKPGDVKVLPDKKSRGPSRLRQKREAKAKEAAKAKAPPTSPKAKKQSGPSRLRIKRTGGDYKKNQMSFVGGENNLGLNQTKLRARRTAKAK